MATAWLKSKMSRVVETVREVASSAQDDEDGVDNNVQSHEPEKLKKVEITQELAQRLRFYDKGDLNELIKEHNSVKSQILEQNAALFSLLEESDQFREEQIERRVKEMRTEIRKIRRDDEMINGVLLLSAQGELSKLQEEREAAIQDLHKLYEQLQTEQKLRGEAQRLSQDLEKEVQASRVELEELQVHQAKSAEVTNLDQETMKKEDSEFEQDNQRALEVANEKRLVEELKALREALEQTRNDIAEKDESFRQLKEANDQLNNDLKAVNGEMASVMEEREKLEAVLVDSKQLLVNLESEVKQAKQEAQDKARLLNESLQKNSDIECTLEAERKRLEDAAASQNEMIAKLKDSLHTKENELENTLVTLKTNSTEIGDLLQKNQQLADQVANFQNSTSVLQSKIESLEEANKNSKESIDSLHADFAEKENKLRSENECLTAALAESKALAKEKYDQARKEIELSIKERDELESKFTAEEEQSRTVLEKLDQMKAELKSITEENNRLIEREKMELEKSENATISNLTSELDRLRTEHETMQSYAREVERQLETEKKGNKGSENKLKKNQIALETMTEELGELRVALEEKENLVKVEREHSEEHVKDIESLKDVVKAKVAEVEEKSSQCTRLQEESTLQEKRARSLEMELEKQTSLMGQKDQQSKEQIQAIERLEKGLKSKESEIEEISSKCESLKEDKAILQQKLQEHSAKIEENDMKISSGEAERSELMSQESQQRKRIQNQEMEIQALSKKLENLQRERDESQANSEALQKKMKEFRVHTQEHAKQVDDATALLQDQSTKLADERDRLRKQLGEVEARSGDLEKELATERNQVQVLREKLHSSESNLQSSMADARRVTEESIAMQENLSLKLTSETEALLHEINDMKSKNVDREAELADEISSKSRALESLTENVKALEKELTQKDHLLKQSESASSKSEKEKESLQTALSEAMEQLAEAQSAVDSRDVAMSSMKSRISDSRNQIGELQTLVEEIRREKTQLEQKGTELEQQRKEKLTELEQQHKQNSELLDRATLAENAKESQAIEISELRERLQKFEKGLEQKESELLESTRMYREAEETAKQVSAQLETTKADLRDYKTRATTLLKSKEAEMTALSSSTDISLWPPQARVLLESKTHEVESREQLLADMRLKLEEKDEELGSLQMQHMTLESEMARSSSQLKQLEHQCQDFESAIDKLKQERDGLSKEKVENSEMIVKLQAMLDNTLSTQEKLEEKKPSNPNGEQEEMPISVGPSPALAKHADNEETGEGPDKEENETLTVSPAEDKNQEDEIMDIAKRQALRDGQFNILFNRIHVLEEQLEESERTHQLKDRAQEILREEIADIRRSQKREGVDLLYLKNIILKYIETGEGERLLPVLSLLLQFSPDEEKKASQHLLSRQKSPRSFRFFAS